MYYPFSLSSQVYPMEVFPLHYLERSAASASSPYLLVTHRSCRNDKFKRIFYMEFCDLSRATHIYIVNYDEEVSIVPKEIKSLLINENLREEMTCFVNRYMTYLID